MKTAGKLAGLLAGMLKSEDLRLGRAVWNMGNLVRETFGKFVSEGLNGEKQKLMEMVAAGKKPQLKGEIAMYDALRELYEKLKELFGLLGYEITL